MKLALARKRTRTERWAEVASLVCGGQESQRFAPPSQRATGQQGTPQQPAVPGQPGRWVPQGSQPQGQGSQYGQAGSYGAAGYPGGGYSGSQMGPGGPVGPGQPPAGGAFGSGSSGRRGFPVWGWVLVAVAAVGVVVGILFATGVFGGGNKEADPTPDPTPTTPDPTPTGSTVERIDEHTAIVDDVTVKVLEFDSDATSVLESAKASEVHDDLEEGDKLVRVKVRVTNGRSEPVRPYSDVGGLVLIDSEQQWYRDFGYYSEDALIKVYELAPGEQAEAVLYFALSKDFDTSVLAFELWSNEDYAHVQLELP